MKRFRTILLLVFTLLLGMVLGAAMVGSFAKARILQVNNFATQSGFTEQILTFVDPVDAAQEAKLRPILDARGAELEQIVLTAREDSNAVLDALRGELEPVLTEAQLAKLEERRKKAQARVARLRGE